MGKSSQGIPALHTLHAPFKLDHINGSVGTPWKRGSSKGRELGYGANNLNYY